MGWWDKLLGEEPESAKKQPPAQRKAPPQTKPRSGPKPEIIPPDFSAVPDFRWNETDLDYYRHEVKRWKCYRRGDYGVLFLPADTSAAWIFHEIGTMREAEERGVASRGPDGGIERDESLPTLLVFRWDENYDEFFGAVQRWEHVYMLIAQDEPLRQQSEVPNPTNIQKLNTGDWDLISPINSGSFGQVWKADNSSGKRAALKLMKIDHMSAQALQDFRQHFRRELHLLLQLDSPRTARALDGDPEATPPWIVTEFIAGEDLLSEISHEGPLSGMNWWQLARDLLLGLQVAHDIGVVHQDVRPPNVMRGTRGTILVDFGIATQIDRSKASASAFTRPRAYSSPEQVKAEPLTAASDVFQAGLTLYFAATGTQAFGGKTIEEVELAIVSQQPNLSRLDSGQQRLLAGMLEKKPSKRITLDEALALCKDQMKVLLDET